MILIHFRVKNTLKNNHNHILKYGLSLRESEYSVKICSGSRGLLPLWSQVRAMWLLI